LVKACKLIKVNGEYIGRVIDLLGERTEIEYGEIPIKESEEINLDLVRGDFSLKVYVDKKEKHDFGWDYLLKLEDYDLIQTATEKLLIKPIRQVEFLLYTEKEIEGFMAIFAKKRLVQLFVEAISSIFKTTEWFSEPVFDLHENEGLLRKEFGNFTRFYTRDMSHELVKSASVGGVALEKSPDYKRYLKDYSGYLSTVVVDYNGIQIMISSSGKIWSPSKQFEERRIEIISEILKKLIRIGVVRF